MTTAPAETAVNPLTIEAVRDAIELLRDHGITPEQYATAKIVDYWSVPGHETAFTDRPAAIAAAGQVAAVSGQPVRVEHMCGADGDFVSFGSTTVLPPAQPLPYAVYASPTGGEPLATFDAQGNLTSGTWPSPDAPATVYYSADPAAEADHAPNATPLAIRPGESFVFTRTGTTGTD
jgi:hypothetical protein